MSIQTVASSQAQSSQLDQEEAIIADDDPPSSDDNGTFLIQDVGDSNENLNKLASLSPLEAPPAKRMATAKTATGGRGTARGRGRGRGTGTGTT